MRVIHINAVADGRSSPGACNEDSGEVPQLELPLVRREFLKGSGILMGTLAAGSVLATLAPSTAWAIELKTLSTAEGDTLLKMGRVLFPHRKLPDAVYALLVKDLDAKAAADAGTAKLLRDGVAALNKGSGGSFVNASAGRKLFVVTTMEGNPFFSAVRGQCVTSLYDNDMAFAALGYPGSAWEKGGYITRGFQDLKWLPAPSVDASPPPYMG